MYLFTEKVTDTDHVVVVIGYNEGLLDAEALSKAIIVESIPPAEHKFGKSSTLHINPETKEMWYTYEGPPTLEEKYKTLEQRLNTALAALDDILINGLPLGRRE